MARRERLICASTDLTNGALGVRFDMEVRGQPAQAFVVRFRDRVHAYLNECRHRATELDWTPGDFFDEAKLYLICASHGAAYDPASGVCVAGPCKGLRLTPVVVEERNGNVICIEELAPHG